MWQGAVVKECFAVYDCGAFGKAFGRLTIPVLWSMNRPCTLRKRLSKHDLERTLEMATEVIKTGPRCAYSFRVAYHRNGRMAMFYRSLLARRFQAGRFVLCSNQFPETCSVEERDFHGF
jgi:hypothetical protein